MQRSGEALSELVAHQTITCRLHLVPSHSPHPHPLSLPLLSYQPTRIVRVPQLRTVHHTTNIGAHSLMAM